MRGFPKSSTNGSGRLIHHHEYVRKLWMDYNKNKPQIIWDFSVSVEHYRISLGKYGRMGQYLDFTLIVPQ